jgi:hypothetical protein
LISDEWVLNANIYVVIIGISVPDTDRQRNRQTDTYTYTQSDRQTDTQIDRDTDRQTDRQTVRQTDSQTDRDTDRQTHTHTQKHRDSQTDRQIHRHRQTDTDRQTDRHRQTDRQTDRQTKVLKSTLAPTTSKHVLGTVTSPKSKVDSSLISGLFVLDDRIAIELPENWPQVDDFSFVSLIFILAAELLNGDLNLTLMGVGSPVNVICSEMSKHLPGYCQSLVLTKSN